MAGTGGVFYVCDLPFFQLSAIAVESALSMLCKFLDFIQDLYRNSDFKKCGIWKKGLTFF